LGWVTPGERVAFRPCSERGCSGYTLASGIGMYALPPAPADSPPPLTVQQQANLDCLGLALSLGDWAKARGETAPDSPLVRVYLRRLNQSDPSKDWRALAVRVPDTILYGDFMGRMNTCASTAASAKHRRAR
jgi:hypothetical protein